MAWILFYLFIAVFGVCFPSLYLKINHVTLQNLHVSMILFYYFVIVIMLLLALFLIHSRRKGKHTNHQSKMIQISNTDLSNIENKDHKPRKHGRHESEKGFPRICDRMVRTVKKRMQIKP